MDKKKHKKFLKVPHLGDEKGLLKKIIKENLVYPEEALKNKIEGDVIITYKVSNMGEVFDCKVVKSLGYGCDEEAKRLIELLNYQEVNNRGVKVTTNNKVKIPFRLPKQGKVKFSYSQKEKAIKDKPDPGSKKDESYNYTITINNNE